MSTTIVLQKIVYLGIDIHKSKYVLCAIEKNEQRTEHFKTIKASAEEIFKYIEDLKKDYGHNAVFVCGFEPGPCGFHLKQEINVRRLLQYHSDPVYSSF